MKHTDLIALLIVFVVAAAGLVMVFLTDGKDNLAGAAVEIPKEYLADLGGAELPKECSDPDGPDAIGSRSTVTQVGYASKTDACAESGVLEAYCSVGGPDYRWVPCPSGTICRDGACYLEGEIAPLYASISDVKKLAEEVQLVTKIVQEAPTAEGCFTCPNKVPVLVGATPDQGTLNGRELCSAAGHSECIQAGIMHQELFFTTRGGSCLSRDADFRNTYSRVVGCDVRGDSRAVIGNPSSVACLSTDASPFVKDWKRWKYLASALCI